MPSDRIKTVVVRCKVNESSARAVERAVDAESPDHVCLGSRGLGSLQGALLNAVGLGSVGEHVVKHVRVPVTVVPLSTPVPENITVRTGVSEHGL